MNFCTSHEKHHQKYNVRWEHFWPDGKPNVADIVVVWIPDDPNIEIFKKNLKEELCENDCIDNKNSLKSITKLPGLYLGTNEKECIQSCLRVNYEFPNNKENLAAILIKELKLRRIDKLSEVAIITEQGYDIADKLTENFKSGYPDGSEIRRFSYFKGLDANQQAIRKRDKPDSQGNDKNWNDYFSLHSHDNPSIGHAQFDYLHRLSHQIKDHNKESHTTNPPKDRIKAVGIFGSDFYDKLIILEALWRENPSIVYFTTELDAQMLQPEYWDWMRNLIVASHFNLQLNEQYQRPFPPFRDSLQTNIYYQILNKIGGKDLAEPSPLIFEIGRNGPVHLPHGLQQELTIEDRFYTFIGNFIDWINRGFTPLESTKHPESNSVNPGHDQQHQLIYYLSFAFLITFALILAEYQMRPNSGAQTFWLLGTAIILFLFMLYALYDTEGEPFSFTDGVSLWPTILIRIFTISLTLAFIIKLIRNLEANFDRLTRKEFPAIKYKPTYTNSIIILEKPLFIDNRRKTEEEILSKKDRSDPKESHSRKILAILAPTTFKILIIIIIYSISTNILTLPGGSHYYIQISSLWFLLVLLLAHLEDQKNYQSSKNRSKNSPPWRFEFCMEKAKKHIKKIISFIIFIIFLIIPCFILLFFVDNTDGLYKTKFALGALILANLLIYTYYLVSEKIKQLEQNLLFITSLAIVYLFYIPVALITLKHPELIWLIAAFLIFIFLDNSSIKSIQEWIQKDSDRFNLHHKKVIDENELWKEYREYGVLEQRLLRTTIMWLIFMNVDVFLTHLFPGFSSFCRGWFSCEVGDWILITSSSLATFLILLVLDAQRLCLHWVEKLRTKHPLLVDETIFINREDKIKLVYRKGEIDAPLQSLGKIITLVAKRTRTVDQLIYFPIIALMLMFFARIVYFDFLDFPISSGITFIICISLLLYAGLKLRSEANRLKLTVIDTIENEIVCTAKEKKEAIKKIREVNYGAFQPMSEQPVVRSALLLLGSLGLFAAEYLMLFGY